MSIVSRSLSLAFWMALVLAASVRAQNFTAPAFYPTNGFPGPVAIVDVDGDGDQDAVVIKASGLLVLRNDGSGSFTAATQSGLWTDDALDVAAGDLDGDGDPDLALALTGAGTGNVGILLNDGGGTFGAARTYPAPGSTHSVAIAELDPDIHSDVTSTGVSFKASIFLNDGTSVLRHDGDYGHGYTSSNITAGDLDGDGDNDIVYTNVGISNLTVLLNAGNGTFGPHTWYNTGDNDDDVVMVDVDGDADLDLATSNLYSDTVSLLLNNGNGTFAAQRTYAAGDTPSGIAAGDFDGDSHPDLVVANHNANTISILRNNADGTFEAPVAFGVGQGPSNVAVGQLNVDDLPDLLVVNVTSEQIAVLLGTAGTPPPPTITLTAQARTIRPRSTNLRWSGATAAKVAIFRNSTRIVTTANDGQHTDSIRARGTYRYKVCQQGPQVCSNEVSVTFP